MDKEKFIQNLLNSFDIIFEEFQNYNNKKTTPLPGFDDANTPLDHWRSVGLWWNYKPMKVRQKHFPKTTNLIEKGPTHRSSGWLLLKGNSSIEKHEHGDWGDKIIFHLPMIVPDGDVGFWIDGEIYRWIPRKPFAFSTRQYHYAFNNTDQLRVIFVLDFDYKEWINVLKPYMPLTKFNCL